MPALRNRLVCLERAAERRDRLALAERVAAAAEAIHPPGERLTIDEILAAWEETEAALAGYRGDRRDVAALTRFLGARCGLTWAEVAEAVAAAERLIELVADGL